MLKRSTASGPPWLPSRSWGWLFSWSWLGFLRAALGRLCDFRDCGAIGARPRRVSRGSRLTSDRDLLVPRSVEVVLARALRELALHASGVREAEETEPHGRGCRKHQTMPLGPLVPDTISQPRAPAALAL